jgi:hypothetical protein
MRADSGSYLQEVYEKLEFQVGPGFYSLSDSTIQASLSQIGWIEQARKLGADAIFFVDDYPTVLFFKLDNQLEADTQENEERIRSLYLRVWNTSRIPIFFVALPFEIRVYSAYQKPVDAKGWQSEDRWLARVETISQIAKEWQVFSRAEIESGRVFQTNQNSFRSEDRVDQWLLRNLRLLRQNLIDKDIRKREYVHAIIGRSIFIRYLEDRDVLVNDYFNISSENRYSRYTDVLNSKEDTYRLFEKLREDFNGDLFPLSDQEKDWVSQSDLNLLGKFLDGRSMGEYPDLLFWAYQFNIIPIELISSIYEEFYYENGGEKDKGTHYTPTTLVDFVLSQCLTESRLDNGARVLDPACGSGIFLVETFKRMVYRECQRKRIHRVADLPLKELTRLITEQITGIDINQSAIQVAAFSLYLAFLDFRDPPDIRQNKKLPRLIYDSKIPSSGKSLICANTFYPISTEQARLLDKPILPLNESQFDIIIGNPPWGQVKGQDGLTAVQWCKAFDYPIGDQEWSQCFIWRTQHLLKPGGEIGLLVSTGVLFKHADKSKAFRKKWLTTNQIRAVYNFAHVRHVFFRKQKKDAISPFAAIFFTPTSTEQATQNQLSYIAIKQSTFAERLQAVVIDKTDLHKIRQKELIGKEWLWKTYMWGGLADADLIDELKDNHQTLGDVITDYGMGYQESGKPKKKSTKELGVDYELDTLLFGVNKPFSELIKPIKHRMIHRLRNLEIYKGPRLLIKRGISRSGPKLGEIQARLAYQPFAFRHSIFGFRLDNMNLENQQMLLGILVSSLAKYYHFLTCSTWGFWHDEIHEEEHLSLPVRFTEDLKLKMRILKAVQQITNENTSPELLGSNALDWRLLQNELDEAIFDLYELTEMQRDLIRDLCQTTLEFFYDGIGSLAVKSPNIEWLKAYHSAFLECWAGRLQPKGIQLGTKIYAPHHGLLCGMAFELNEIDKLSQQPAITEDGGLQIWYRQLSRDLRREWTEGIYVDRVVKEITETGMFLLKRAERRLWTRSQARQDAQELLTEVFKLEWQK